MQPIKTLYLVNHTHTDIGFTDFQDNCFRQHAEFIEQALDLIEATADYPEEARYRWICETTGPLERYLKNSSPAQLERFRHWHRRGAIDIAGMQYNLTPLLNLEQIHRSLYPIRRLRDKYGLSVEAVMQDDVNGISWAFADLLPACEIKFLTLAINPVRGGAPKPRPSAFWWEGPAGGRILTWNGYHYLFGRSMAALGDPRFADQFFPAWITKLEKDPDYPFDFLYCEATHPTRVDNGPPDQRISDFVRKWNEEGRTPRIVITTVTAFGRRLRSAHGKSLPTWRGDWTDWWADGAASSAYETGINRSTHELLLTAETIEAWLRTLGRGRWDAVHWADLYEQTTLFDEHSWGAFSSIAAPQSLFSKAQWNRKAGYAYTASMTGHDVLARAAGELAGTCSKRGPEGVFNLGNLAPEAAYPPSGYSELLVINTLPWTRSVRVEEPELRGGTAPVGMLDMFFPPSVPWGGNRPPTPLRRIEGEVPGLGFAFLPLAAQAPEDDLKQAMDTIENAYYRVRLDPKTGALAEWFDKEINHDFASTYRSWEIGQYIYEWVESEKGRDALFVQDFAAEDFGLWQTDVPFRYATASDVKVHSPRVEQGRVSIKVSISARGVRRAHCVFALDSRRKGLSIDWLLDKEHQEAPEAVFIAFPFKLGDPQFRVDLNAIPCTPDQDQLPGSVRDWYPLQRWVSVTDSTKGVTLVPLDAPLVHLGGITTGRWTKKLQPEGPTVMSWALNNHWMVNFKASQGGEIPLRYRLTTYRGSGDDVQAARFAAEAVTPPIVLRDRLRRGQPSGRFITLPEDAGVLLTAKPAEDGRGIVLRLQNLRPAPQLIPIKLEAAKPISAHFTSPLEVDEEPLEIAGNVINVALGSLALRSVRVKF